MRKRLLACFLALAMVLGMMPAAALSAHAEETTVTPPFTSITTEDGEAVSYSYKGAIPAVTDWMSYEDGPYYHVTIPEGTESVLVTYPADVGIAGAPSAFSYTLSVPEYEMGYGSAYFTVVTNDDGSKTVTIPVANYLLTDGTGTAMSLEAEGSFDPITFFSFEYGEVGTEEPETSEPEETGKAIASGTCGDALTWKLFDDGVLEISGTGAMTDFGNTTMPWKDYQEQITKVVLPDGLTSIGMYAFYNCKVLADVNIPGTVETIGNFAFCYCYEVTELTIPKSVTTIGNSAFSNCTGLTELVIPNSVTSIGSDAFECCSNLKKITLPAGLGTILSETFYKCEALASIEIPASVTSIGMNAFAYSGLKEIVIGDAVTSIDASAFAYSKLEKATLGKGLTKVANYLFNNCTALTEVVLPDTITEIGIGAFQRTGLTEFTVGDSVKTIGNGAFRSCTSLKSIVLGKNVSSIGNSAFRACSSLTGITFLGSAPTLGTKPFQEITATAYCPCSWKDSTCTATYGGATALTWVKTHTYENGACTVCGEADPEAAVNALSAMSFHSTWSSNDTDYALATEFDPATKEYTLLVPDRFNACYVKVTLADGVEGTIQAAWVNLNNDDSRTSTLTSGKSGQTLTGAVKTGNYKNTVTITVTGEDFEDVYTVNIVRTPTLTALGLDGIKLNETFQVTNDAYTASTAAESVTVTSTPRDESYTVTVNGGEDATVALEMGENVITVVVKNEDGYEKAYTITVTRKATITVSFEVNVDNARITLTDANKTVVVPVDGVYTLISGETYSYTVQKDGYIGQTNNFTLEESGVIEIELDEATENPNLDKTIYAQWANFRNGPNHLGITSARTPYDPEDAELLWAAKYGTGWAAAPGSPIMVDGDIITYVGSTIKRLDSMTGEVVAEGTMVASSSYSIVPATYADGMIFVGLSGGRIQAFNAKTLESLWVYKDELGGQPNCPITYKDGYIYAGFWNSETKDANFACIYTIDEDHENTTESKLASWTYTRTGGFYWAGAYASDKFVVVGTDDGASGYETNGASLLVFDRITGELVSHYDNIRGDIRSNVSYDPSSDRVFFTSKGGILCNAKVDWETGAISSFNQVTLQDANGNANAMSTCTPSVYNDRIYIGVCGTSQFGDNSGHGIAVYDLNSDGTMTRAYTYAIKGYPQTSAMVTTAYADEDEGYVYIYLPYNSTPGGVSVLKDKKGQTAPLTTTDSGYSEVFTPVSPLSQYCICATIADEYGTIYYKNDSCYMMAITSKIESLELTGTPSDEGFKAETHQVNGTDRDVTDYVEITQDTTAGTWSVSYTYGFDNDNYGLKTLAVSTVTLPEGDGYTVTGEATANSWEPYTFTVALSGCYEKGENFAVKVNGEAVNANEDGSYTVENVTTSLIITVEGVEPITFDITVYYADNGQIVTSDKDNTTVLNFAPVTVSDVNGDGKFTMYDGFYCFHEQYHKNGAAGYTDSGWITQFWSVSTSMVSYGHNNGWVYSTAEEIADGDSICLFTYQDQLSWSDLYTYFDSTTGTAKAGEDTSFTVNGVSFMYSSSSANVTAAPVGATVTATKKGSSDTLTTTVGEDGTFTLNFTSDGTWTVLVSGKCTYTPVGGYASGQPITDAPIAPAMMTVTVEAPTYTITLPESESYTVSPATGYTTSVKGGESFKFFVEPKVGYQKGENFTVKADGQTLTADSNGYYTLENVTANVTITVEGVEAIVWEPVTVYFSISDDDEYQIGKDSKEVMALRKISVPYFDLGLYGLEDFYFSSETYGSDGGAHSSDLVPGTAEYAYGKVTLLHLYIYALEVYYCGLDEDEAGQGYLYDQNLIGTEVLTITGSSGSLYMNQFWGGDENLNYYVNYQYPLASAGWGSTSDQILLRENDVITLGHFTSWSFYSDPEMGFNYLTPDEDNDVYGTTTVTQGDKLTLNGYRAGADMTGNYTTAHTLLTSQPAIYYAEYDNVTSDVTEWTKLGNLSADGTIVFDTTSLKPGTYVVAMAGQKGSVFDDICSTPGGIIVVVEEKDDLLPGDVNGDGQITTVDVTMVQMYLKGNDTLTEDQLAAADVNGDGKVTTLDLALMKMYIKNKLDNFPNAK